MNLTQLTQKVLGIAARIDAFILGDTWHLISLSASWTNPGAGSAAAQYRLTRDSGVWIVATIAPGTLADGTVIFTLPTGYRPNKQVCFNVSVQSTGSAVFSANNPMSFASIETTGQCKIFGCNLGGIDFLHIDAIVPLDTLN